MLWGNQPYAGDVCITVNNTSVIYNKKTHKYKDFIKQTEATCLPFAMTVYGAHDPKTVALLEEVQRKYQSGQFVSDILRLTTIACICGNAHGIHRLKNRDPLMSQLAAQIELNLEEMEEESETDAETEERNEDGVLTLP